ncbi:MAG: hypothetical protein AAGE37_00825 [Pseudomonadota bacterium]
MIPTFGRPTSIACVVIIMVLAALLPVSPAAARDSCFQDRSPLKSERIMARLTSDPGDNMGGNHGLYHEACDGGLYLVDMDSAKRIVRVNESWFFDNLISARWLKGSPGEQLEVIANFYVGAGPTAAQPFPARFLVTRNSDGQFVARQDEKYSSNWQDVDLADWSSPNAASLAALMAPVLNGTPESAEDQPLINIYVESDGRTNPNLSRMAADLPARAGWDMAAILVERTGFLDDSVSGDRHYGLAMFVNGQWRLEQLWVQYLCGRGANPRQWQANLCP